MDDNDTPDFTVGDLGEMKVTVRRTYSWTFEPVLVEAPWRELISAVEVTIAREPSWDSDFVRFRAYGVAATKSGKPDNRSRYDWYRYPGMDFFQPYIDRAIAEWADVEGEFREEPDDA